MPNYSYSGNEYTDKNNYVDETDADDINDLQDEVETVEGVLVGGDEGQVLTADATGKAGWEDASGGGASFLWDGITWNMTDNGNDTYSFDIELTSGGVAIESDAVFNMFAMNIGFYNFSNIGTFLLSEGDEQFRDIVSGTYPEFWLIYYDADGDNSFILSRTASTFYSWKLAIIKPNGGIALSETMTWEVPAGP